LYLKRLELTGFKSFADRTELEFGRGITAVVGPNGSGKSNLSDAIRWVLGEQSAKTLRGGNMQDVIFGGSQTRRQVNYGEVSLTLDNSDRALPLDFTEVTVTRRLHRDGESEYFINRQPCRLKDIVELFMDTGVGKEAYSVIGQGRIDEILSPKSEDRRAVFEEAAGIVRYKARKREAEKKLAETEQNLLRLADLLAELESRLVPLKEQSDRAMQYKDLRDRLTAREIGLYVKQIETLREAWESECGRLEQLRVRHAELAAAVGRDDARLASGRLELKRMEDELERLRKERLEVSAELEAAERSVEVLDERGQHLVRGREERLLRIAGLEEQLRAAAAEAASAQARSAELSARLKDCSAELAEAENRLSEAEAEGRAEIEEEYKTQLIDVLNELAQVRNECRYAEQQIETLSRRIERLSSEAEEIRARAQSAAAAAEAADGELERVRSNIAALQERYVETSRKLQTSREELRRADVALRTAEKELDGLKSRRDALRELADDYDGFAQGVRSVLKAKRRGVLGGVHGAVAELIEVPAGLEVAVETALGGALQHIVVETERDGREAIAYLKRENAGRATFLPLDVVRGRCLSESDRKAASVAEGWIGVASELVRFAERYRAIVENLLGVVIVAKTLEDANRIAAILQYRYRVVTLEGDVVHPGGSMTGGSLLNRTGELLGRRRRLEELDRAVDQAERTLEERRKCVESIRAECASAESELERLRDVAERLRLEEQRLAAERDRRREEERQENERLLDTLRESEELARERSGYETALQVGLRKAGELAAREEYLRRAVEEAQAGRKLAESRRDELRERVTAIKVRWAALESEKTSADTETERLRRECARLEADLASERNQLAASEKELEENGIRRLECIERANILRLKLRRLDDEAERLRAERAERQAALEKAEDETHSRRADLREAEKAMHESEIRLNRLDVELDNALRKLAEDYGIGFELARQSYPVPDDPAAAQQEVRDLRRRIADLGDVHLGAIEEYRSVAERYEFLKTQRDDLMQAKEALYRVIREIDDEMARRFRSTFERIRERFGEVFARLFGGGTADLRLADAERPLESDIEIVAQPPGKKLQNLQLLSGGERALTAIALLFAILHVKPVPFCVLDEVEAALDEANVVRFAQYLRERSAETQFIVVTHRKGTMEEADVLYGVTMEEDGVSKLVSVRLDGDRTAVSALTAARTGD